jgi:[ribosomal protein S18]-alanine N-acetyltransferase
VERVKERGAHELFLEVRESNEAAQRVYRERGFVVVGRRKSYYSAPVEDALVMRLRV